MLKRVACDWCGASDSDGSPLLARSPIGDEFTELKEVCSVVCKLEMESFTPEGATRLLAYHTPGAFLGWSEVIHA